MDKITGNSSPLLDLTVYSSKRAEITSDFVIVFTRNLPETSVAGFQRFPDNPSLTDHMVQIRIDKKVDEIGQPY